MEVDYEEVGRDFVDISNRYDEAMKSAESPQEVYALIDNFLAELRELWLENK